MKKVNCILILALAFAFQGVSQQTPAPAQTEAVSITGATAHVGDGTVVENATIVFEEGKITALGTDMATKGTVIDASGKHVYPGFIAPNKSIGAYRGKRGTCE